jgi:hypothetical protein
MQSLITQTQLALQRHHMPVVLVQQVLEFLGMFEYLLRTVLLFTVTKHPALHVLSFHHKHTEPGKMMWSSCVVSSSMGRVTFLIRW